MASQDTEPLRQLYASQPDPAFGFDENLKVAWLNPACRQTLLSVAEGVYLPEVFPDFGLEAVKDRVREQGVGLFRNRRSSGRPYQCRQHRSPVPHSPLPCSRLLRLRRCSPL